MTTISETPNTLLSLGRCRAHFACCGKIKIRKRQGLQKGPQLPMGSDTKIRSSNGVLSADNLSLGMNP